MPGELPLKALSAAGCGPELFLLEDHAEIQTVVNERLGVGEKRATAKDGYHAVLMCLSPGLPSPQKIYLKFDHPTGCPPVAGLSTSPDLLPGNLSPVWMYCITNYLVLGMQKPDLSMPSGNSSIGAGYEAGIWLLPIAPIESRIAVQKQVQAV